MAKKLLFLLLLLFFSSCGSSHLGKSSIQISFLDDYIIPAEQTFENTKIGGLSGIDFQDDEFYFICDDSGNPRFYNANIPISNGRIDSVEINKLTRIKKAGSALANQVMDMESIRKIPGEDKFVISSEGYIKGDKDPSIFSIDSFGNITSTFKIPENYSAVGEQHPRSNGVFEGLAIGLNNNYWAATELPLEKDGPKPKLFCTNSPIRITQFDTKGTAQNQFAMKLGRITKIPWLYFAVNGVTEILEYAPQKFLVLERGFAAGHGSNGNTVKVFDVDASQASNTLEFNSLKKQKYTVATKKLIFNFKSVKKQLQDKIIDNIEGMTFGPDLPNGNKTILFISDNNFNSLGKQITQIILMEIKIP